MKKTKMVLLVPLIMMMTGVLLMTGCSSTQGLTTNGSVQPNGNGNEITAFDFINQAGNQIVYSQKDYDLNGNVYSAVTLNYVVSNTDYVSSNSTVNHSKEVIFTFGSYLSRDYYRMTGTALEKYVSVSNSFNPVQMFPINNANYGSYLLGYENINTPLGVLYCAKLKYSYNNVYSIVWYNQKYAWSNGVKIETYNNQDVLISSMEMVYANY